MTIGSVEVKVCGPTRRSDIKGPHPPGAQRVTHAYLDLLVQVDEFAHAQLGVTYIQMVEIFKDHLDGPVPARDEQRFGLVAHELLV